jgi:Ca2+-binding EF-hand superfamily protein
MSTADAARMCEDMSGRTGGEFIFASFAQAVSRHQKGMRQVLAREALVHIESTASVGRAAASEFGGAPVSGLGERDKALFLVAKTKNFTMPDDAALSRLWHQYDASGTGLLSLAKIDDVVHFCFPQYDHKPALMRAYKFADADGSGFVDKREFRLLLRSLVYFNDLYKEFAQIDTTGDNKISFDEFMAGATHLGLGLNEAEAAVLFAEMDSDGGGSVLFNEFCSHLARLKAESHEPSIGASA